MADYSKQTWVNGSAGGTKINAARLGVLESGVYQGSLRGPVLVVGSTLADGVSPPGVELTAAAHTLCTGANDGAEITAAAVVAAAQGRVLRLVGKFLLKFVEHPSESAMFRAIRLPSNVMVDARGALLETHTASLGATSWPGALTDGSRYALIGNSDLSPATSSAVDRNICWVGGKLDGKAATIEALGSSTGQIGRLATNFADTDSGLNFDGFEFTQAADVRLVDVEVVNCRGNGGGDGNNATYAISFEGCVTSLATGCRTSGVSGANGNGIGVLDCDEVEVVDCVTVEHGGGLAGGFDEPGHGLVLRRSWGCSARSVASYGNDGYGAVVHFGHDNTLAGCRLGHWDDEPHSSAAAHLLLVRAPNAVGGLLVHLARRLSVIGSRLNGNGVGVRAVHGQAHFAGCELIGNDAEAVIYADDDGLEVVAGNYSQLNFDESNVFAHNNGASDSTDTPMFGTEELSTSHFALWYGTNSGIVEHSGFIKNSGESQIDPSDIVAGTYLRNRYPFPVWLYLSAGVSSSPTIHVRRGGRAQQIGYGSRINMTSVLLQPQDEVAFGWGSEKPLVYIRCVINNPRQPVWATTGLDL